MEIVLEIAPQKATHLKKRLAVLEQYFRDGSLLLSARDGEKPAQFILHSKDSFPWLAFFKKLRVFWWASSHQAIPYAFRLQKRVPEELLAELDLLSEPELLDALAALRANKYFPPLPKSPF
ncbi:MAG TPA: hypothetical protein PLT31_02770 [Fibrobacteraceae bacterium]|jgi:hypothetical protein|nr:hypothetical protein [Fibrobacter sp.]HOG68166.1 hypothetical protein [Fibrobacteraceae bacterium]HPW94090.1 hypothetical protein [Fibrobacteraceae bacterium]